MAISDQEATRHIRILGRYLSVAPLSRSLIRAREIAMIADRLGGDSKGRIIDLGHGDGHFAAVLEEEGVRLFAGLDRSLDELRRARGRTATHLVVGDMERAPFRAGIFAAAVSNCVLEHVERIETAFDEAARILAPGGVFLATVVTDRYEALLFWPRFFERIGLAGCGRRYLDFIRHRFQHCRYLAAGDWVGMARAAGFTAVETATYIGRWRQRLMDLFLPFMQAARLLRFVTGREVIPGLRPPAGPLVRWLQKDDASASAGDAANALLVLKKDGDL